jgi:hypothetical protein
MAAVTTTKSSKVKWLVPAVVGLAALWFIRRKKR